MGVDPVSRQELWNIIYDYINKVQAYCIFSTAYLEEAAKAEARATEEAKAEVEVVAQTSQSVVQTIDVTASGYSSDGADAYCPGYITATGINLYEQPNVIAVNPSVIPLGTRVSIPGLGEYIAGDTGGAIGGSRIDIHFPTIAAALEWGMRNITIQILE